MRLFKWLLDPFALVGVYLLLVSVVLNRPGTAPGLSLACAVVPFQLLMMSVTNVSGVFESYRSVLLYGERPSAWQLLVPTAFSLAVLAITLPIYVREQKQFAKVVA